jgi:chromosome segregation ATPase
MEVEQKEEWSDIDTSKPESKEEEDKVDFEVEKTSEDKEEKVEAVVEEKPVAETKTETKKEDTQPEEQPDEAKDIESERAQKRIRQLVRQRKEKEEEVARLLAEKQDLQSRLTQNQTNQFDLTKTSIESQEKSLENQLNLAKQNYLDAFEKDDKNQLLKAQEALNEAQINLNNIKSNKVNFDKDYENYQNSIKQQPVQQSQPQQPQYDPKAVAWAEKNEWFGQDKMMTAAALALDAQLKDEGFNPADDDFYKEVDVRLKDAFPNKFKTSEQETQQVRQKATSSPSQVVAGTSRTPASKKIKLSQEDVRLANKWNIPLDRYAKEKSKVETGEEYTTITTQMRRS